MNQPTAFVMVVRGKSVWKGLMFYDALLKNVYILRLYSDPLWHPKYNLLFVLSGGGKLNYFGTKYFIEDMLEDAGKAT